MEENIRNIILFKKLLIISWDLIKANSFEYFITCLPVSKIAFLKVSSKGLISTNKLNNFFIENPNVSMLSEKYSRLKFFNILKIIENTKLKTLYISLAKSIFSSFGLSINIFNIL